MRAVSPKQSIRDSVAFWRVLAGVFALGLAVLLWQHRSPAGEEPLPSEAQGFLDMLVFMDEASGEEAIAVAQHFGGASELPRAHRTARVRKMVERLSDLDPEARSQYLEWVEIAPYRIDGDSMEFEVIDHDE